MNYWDTPFAGSLVDFERLEVLLDRVHNCFDAFSEVLGSHHSAHGVGEIGD